MSTEIAARDLADEYRYNALPDIARHLNLSMSNRALWKDRAVLELSVAVLHSWDKAKTTMVDQHSASDSFIAWYDKEMKTRGHCPADWVWIVPPTSSATTKVFHQEMFSYVVKPGVVELPVSGFDGRIFISISNPLLLGAPLVHVLAREGYHPCRESSSLGDRRRRERRGHRHRLRHGDR